MTKWYKYNDPELSNAWDYQICPQRLCMLWLSWLPGECADIYCAIEAIEFDTYGKISSFDVISNFTNI